MPTSYAKGSRSSVSVEGNANRFGKRWLLELFVWGNLSFLAVDIYVAHSVNEFALWQGGIPFVFSLAVSLVLVPGLI